MEQSVADQLTAYLMELEQVSQGDALFIIAYVIPQVTLVELAQPELAAVEPFLQALEAEVWANADRDGLNAEDRQALGELMQQLKQQFVVMAD